MTSEPRLCTSTSTNRSAFAQLSTFLLKYRSTVCSTCQQRALSIWLIAVVPHISSFADERLGVSVSVYGIPAILLNILPPIGKYFTVFLQYSTLFTYFLVLSEKWQHGLSVGKTFQVSVGEKKHKTNQVKDTSPPGFYNSCAQRWCRSDVQPHTLWPHIWRFAVTSNSSNIKHRHLLSAAGLHLRRDTRRDERARRRTSTRPAYVHALPVQ